MVYKFVDMAKVLCESLENEGHWADFIDPSSGRPVNMILFCFFLSFIQIFI
jgi:hypothetical protein